MHIWSSQRTGLIGVIESLLLYVLDLMLSFKLLFELINKRYLNKSGTTNYIQLMVLIMYRN